MSPNQRKSAASSAPTTVGSATVLCGSCRSGEVAVGKHTMQLDLDSAPELTSQFTHASRKVLTEVLREASHLKIGHLEKQFWAWDEHACDSIYNGTKRNPIIKLLCSLLSISGDEAVWFIFPVIIASILTIVQGGPHTMSCANLTCDMEFFLDLFGGMAVCAVVEQILKGFFQRPRPDCRPYDNKYCCILGESYSFPSGHSMRALYAFNWMFWSTHAMAMLNLPRYLEPFVLVWALGVGYARVAAGRHHPIDVIVGDFVGLAVSRVVENQLTDYQRAMVKIVAGVLVALQVWFLLLGPILKDTVQSAVGRHTPAYAVSGLVGALYFAFYASALVSVVNAVVAADEQDCVVGRFSLAFAGEEYSGSSSTSASSAFVEYQCRQWTNLY